MKRVKRAHGYFRFELIAFVALSLGMLSSPKAYGISFEFLRCNGPVIEAEDLSIAWDENDAAGTGIRWGNLAACGQTENYASGTGDAFCVTTGINNPGYDARLETNSFTLEGATSAVLKFTLNYQDVVAGSDLFEVDVSTNGGGSWTTEMTWDFDVGANLGAGTGVEVSVPLNVYLGQSDVEVRWRYYDAGAAPDNGFYVQIDDIYMDCLGGADMRSSAVSNKALVLAGEELAYTIGFHNDGPVTATDAIGIGSVPLAFTVVDSAFSQGVPLPGGFADNTFAADLGTILSGDSASLVVTGRAGIAPEVTLDVLSPLITAGNYEAAGATFGPSIDPSSPVSGLVILADDNDSTGGTTDDACQPLINAAEVDGNIAMVLSSGACSNDEQVKNAQDAGARAVIVMSEGSGFFPFPISPEYIELLGGLVPVMEPSGNVAVPITIPSIRISFEVGSAIRLNIVNSVMVRLNGLEVLSQEQKFFGFTLADEFDPDSSSGFEAIIFLGESNNFSSTSITVLKDSDGDGVADIDDGCRSDSLKTSPGTCGCGLTEADLDVNGITDCLTTEELKDKLARAKKLVKQLKQLKLTGNAKKDKKRKKKQKEVKTALKALLAEIVSTVVNPILPILTIDSSVDLEQLASRAEKSGKKATKTNSGKFSQNKRKARRDLSKLAKALA